MTASTGGQGGYPPNWYPDPHGPAGQFRWFDGASWTNQTQDQQAAPAHQVVACGRDEVSEPEVVLVCVDCKVCKKGGRRSKFGIATKAALTGGLTLLGEAARSLSDDCSLCGHKETDHKDGLKKPGFAFTPGGGAFDFEPIDAIGFRAATCIQAATSDRSFPSYLEVMSSYNLIFFCDRIDVFELKGERLVATAPYSSLSALQVGGPGVQTSGGGFMGGGFGLDGFAVGAATAMLLNKLTSRTSIQTVLRIEVRGAEAGIAEWLFLTSVDSPEAVDRMLKPITLRLADTAARSAQSMASSAPQQAPRGGDRLAHLRELGELRDSGVLSPEEFEQMKAEILSSGA